MRDVENGHKTPEQYLGMCVYLSKLTIQKRELLNDLFLHERTTYPFLEFRCLGQVIAPKSFISMGNSDCENFINFQTGEYCINDKKGIGLSNELKAIYWLVRAHEFGISFETLASLIYEDDDFAGLFLIKKRIKQVILRLKTHYGLDISSKNYRAYLSKSDVNKFYLCEKGKLRIESPFSMSDFISYYDISQSKARAKLLELEKSDIVKLHDSEKKKIYTLK